MAHLPVPETPRQRRTRTLRAMRSIAAKLALSVLGVLTAFLIRLFVTRYTGPLPPFIIYNPTVVALAQFRLLAFREEIG